ncbi:hypothetical protein [Vulcanococcus sp.]|jgi:hypothetical protein|uniref:hypothetical protein n=1 Tax=Vulcanococcus sp. TaxID=2856995 RepID=UPI00323A4369
MGADPLDSLRLALMQDVLPVGMAVVERARRGGARDVADVFSQGADPLGQLREEGEDAARQVRERLDRIQPGLGNPVMKVDVKDVPVSVRLGDDPVATVSADRLELQASLARISERLLLLEQRLTPVS